MVRFRYPLLLAALNVVAAPTAAANGATAVHATRPAHRSAPVAFGAPATYAVAGETPRDAFGLVLPSGQIVHPAGASVVVGQDALGVALSPDGRYAIVSNDDALDRAGSLAVVDTTTMHVVDDYANPGERFFCGVTALRDPQTSGGTLVLASGGADDAVYVFDLDANGMLVPDGMSPKIDVPKPSDTRFANARRAFPATLVASADGTRVFVVDELGDDVAQIDVAARRIVGGQPSAGFFPFAAALVPNGLLVANEGLMNYALLDAPATAPPFAPTPNDLTSASSLSLIPQTADGSLAGAPSVSIPMDRTPDGIVEAGGAHPSAVAVRRDGADAFVAMSGVDRVATIRLGAQPRVVGGTELRLFNDGPYGTQPSALALTRNGKRLYVALAGINAIAVLDASDPVRPHRLGLIPTGWYPAALALSNDDRTLFVVNARGLRSATANASNSLTGSFSEFGTANAAPSEHSTLEKIDLATVGLRRATIRALSYLRKVHVARASGIVPDRFNARGGAARIKHVVLVLEEDKTFDSVLGDLTDASGRAYGAGDASLVEFGASVTPNLHALARRYALAGNFYAQAGQSQVADRIVDSGVANLFTQRMAGNWNQLAPFDGSADDPEDYPRAGTIFNFLWQRHLTFRDYGALMRVAGYDQGAAPSPQADDPLFVDEDDAAAPTRGLGGLYTLDARASPVLAGHVDLDYPGWNLRIRDVRRASEFIRDFSVLVAAGAMPSFTEIWLPDDHGGAGPDIPPLAEEVADGDRALGRIVDYLTHTPQWRSTAIFIEPAASGTNPDHVSPERSYALVVSPYAKRHYVSNVHLCNDSVLKTEEELLGLPALSLGDALASDMSPLFTSVADFSPYVHIDAAPQPSPAPDGAPSPGNVGATQRGTRQQPRGGGFQLSAKR